MTVKDTVMSDEEMIKALVSVKPHYNGSLNELGRHRALAQAQAEISFKAGFDEGFDKGCVFNYHEAKQAGIKEVVEWLNKSDWGRRKGFNWQAKLKEWGIG